MEYSPAVKSLRNNPIYTAKDFYKVFCTNDECKVIVYMNRWKDYPKPVLCKTCYRKQRMLKKWGNASLEELQEAFAFNTGRYLYWLDRYNSLTREKLRASGYEIHEHQRMINFKTKANLIDKLIKGEKF